MPHETRSEKKHAALVGTHVCVLNGMKYDYRSVSQIGASVGPQVEPLVCPIYAPDEGLQGGLGSKNVWRRHVLASNEWNSTL